MKNIDCENIYKDGFHYDLINKPITEDIPFYLSQIRRYGDPVLELACGTGRITIPIADAGFEIIGLDMSASMLRQAKRKADERRITIEWVKADCREFDLNKKFSVIFIPFNSIAHIHDLESIEALFGSVKKHLKDGGKFIIDAFVPKLEYLVRNPEKRYPVAKYQDPYGKGKMVVTETNVYDNDTQINRIKWYSKLSNKQDEVVEELNMKMYYPQELDLLLHYNGFVIDHKFGNYDSSPFVSASPKQLIICSKK